MPEENARSGTSMELLHAGVLGDRLGALLQPPRPMAE